ncbi:MAG: cupin domain-containing protein [Vicinamibacterales bacterium]|nr:cupin domain-containing protein [Vicinamibacterales bacterium]
MRNSTRLIVIGVASTLPFAALAQSGSSKPATYITKEEVDTVNKQPGGDRQIKVADIGSENFAVGIVHRGATGAPTAGGGGAGAARANTPAPEPCGERAATPPPAGTPSGLTHDQQTEGYYIVSGGGTMVTGGHLVNGRRSAADSAVTRELNGPSCSGPVLGPDVVTREVKVGDIIIIPAGTPHGWVNIPDHVDYLSFRPSARVLTAGYVHPSIKK